jgi:hypothetical protein
MNDELENKYNAVIALYSEILSQNLSQEDNEKFDEDSWFLDLKCNSRNAIS